MNNLVLMVGSAGGGGILTVIQFIQSSRLSGSWRFFHVASHDSVGVMAKLWLAMRAGVVIFVKGASRRASILHLHAAMKGSFWRKALYGCIGKMVGLPTIFHLHASDMVEFYEEQGFIGRLAIRRALESSERVVVLSESWKSFVLSIAPKARTEVIYNAVKAPATFNSASRSIEQPFVLLFLGVVGDRKGIFDLVESVASVERRYPGKLKLIVAGDGEISRLTSKIEALGIQGCVSVLGWIDSVRREELLLSSHALALPSYNEGLPMALLEAMSYGLPVITTGVGGIPELVTCEVEGFVRSPGDISGVADDIACWIVDEARRVSMGSAARRRVMSQFDAEKAIVAMDRVYSELVRQRLN